MAEIEKPSFRSQDLPGKFQELNKYLFSVVDQINWNLNTLQNKQASSAREISMIAEITEKKQERVLNGVTFTAKFKKMGTVVHVILSAKKGEDTIGTTGTVSMLIPNGFTPTFYEESIPIMKNNDFSCFLGPGKITIDYDFGNNDAALGAYFQYIS